MLSCLQDNIEDWSKVTGNRYVTVTVSLFLHLMFIFSLQALENAPGVGVASPPASDTAATPCPGGHEAS